MASSFLKASPGTGKLVFLLGHPLGHSLSPAMQNAAFQTLGLPWLYVPIDTLENRLKNILSSMRILPVAGANVTVPYKAAVIPYLDGIEPEAKWLGSVNTIYRKGSKLYGASSDGEGFLRSLGPWRKKLKGSRGLLLGAGGAARAVAGALSKSGIKGIGIANRSPRKAGDLARSLRQRYGRLEIDLISFREAEKYLAHCDWVIQATSVGLKKGEAAPISLQAARPATWAVELIYHRETEFMKEARVRRLPLRDGMEMLLHQGALSLEKWTHRKAPLNVMRRVLLGRLGSTRI